MKIYRIARGWAIFVYVFASLFIIGMAWGVVLAASSLNAGESKSWLILFIVVVGLAACSWIVLETRNSALIITNDHVQATGFLWMRTIKLHEVRGFRMSDRYLFIEPMMEGKKPIKVGDYFDGKDEILAWLKGRFPNLDRFYMVQDREQIPADPSFGLSPERRAEKLEEAKQTARAMTIADIAVAAWLMLFPRPYNVAIFAAIAMFVASIGVVRFYRGLIRFEEKKGSAHPSILFGFMAITFSVLLRASFDFNLFDYTVAMTVAGIVAVPFIGMAGFKNPEFKFKTGADRESSFTIIVFALLFSFGAVVMLNGLLDTSRPEIFKTKVVSKRVKFDKINVHYITPEPWGGQKEPREATVSPTFYDRIEPGETITIRRYRGEFNIPWFQIDEAN